MSEKNLHDTIRAIHWRENQLELLDQRLLPHKTKYVICSTVADVASAIQDMVVRGAPAIGITAAYGVVLAARLRYQQDQEHWKELIEKDLELLSRSRPTAVNLFWALGKMKHTISISGHGDPVPELLKLAVEIHENDIAANHRMGDLGAALLEGCSDVITHCNTGSLATGGYGTALGVIRSAFMQGKIRRVYADETRPWWQGARLTAWELVQDHIPVSLIADSAGAYLMKTGKISWVIVGSDRIAANGDVANKIGTYSAAVAARYHGVKFMVAAPTSTIDMTLNSGDDIPIESRDPSEILNVGGNRIAAEGSDAWNPVFDVTPAKLVDAIVTEKGVVLHPTKEKMEALMKGELQ
jgi:methylthioribose-1-phosphate isomerase